MTTRVVFNSSLDKPARPSDTPLLWPILLRGPSSTRSSRRFQAARSGWSARRPSSPQLGNALANWIASELQAYPCCAHGYKKQLRQARWCWDASVRAVEEYSGC